MRSSFSDCTSVRKFLKLMVVVLGYVCTLLEHYGSRPSGKNETTRHGEMTRIVKVKTQPPKRTKREKLEHLDQPKLRGNSAQKLKRWRSTMKNKKKEPQKV
ncbi:hypothetical protein NPIL_337571 [Nephila pilipes]|uniref:Uncharacterized protein n=1 Tax=Nephila pilipes TaxID=299642 RepID=A0A8X6PVH3_NEPPI|nr:hypothetical protein NPIL_337571 [Nephila pilipes]